MIVYNLVREVLEIPKSQYKGYEPGMTLSSSTVSAQDELGAFEDKNLALEELKKHKCRVGEKGSNMVVQEYYIEESIYQEEKDEYLFVEIVAIGEFEE